MPQQRAPAKQAENQTNITYEGWAEGAVEHFLGIDIGGTKLLTSLFDGACRATHSVRRATGRELSPKRLVALVADVVKEIRADGAEVDSLGLGFPGLVNSASGLVLSSVILSGWCKVPLAGLLSDTLGLPCAVDNDVKNAARAEVAARRASDDRDMLFVSVGTGIGGAVVLNGRIWSGATGLAGEIGHVSISRTGPKCNCGRNGCVGVMASGTSIESRLNLPHGSLAQMIEADDPAIKFAIEDAAEVLGAGIASALNLLNLPLVVLGGGVAELGADYLALVERAARREAFDEIAETCRFELSRVGYEAGAVGAALLARERFGCGLA